MQQIDVNYGKGVRLLAGVDEAGRGPLAGPVIAAAVILDPEYPIDGLDDSKALSEKRREILAAQIQDHAIAWGLGRAEIEEIDRLNILHATMLAMRRAVYNLGVEPEYVLVDGNRCPELDVSVAAVVKGDKLVPAISAASIVAKVTRDEEMVEMDRQYPGYGFARHKGYPTKQHIEALARLGVCAIHRQSYGPVRRFL